MPRIEMSEQLRTIPPDIDVRSELTPEAAEVTVESTACLRPPPMSLMLRTPSAAMRRCSVVPDSNAGGDVRSMKRSRFARRFGLDTRPAARGRHDLLRAAAQSLRALPRARAPADRGRHRDHADPAMPPGPPARGTPFELIHYVRDRAAAAHADDLSASPGDHLTVHEEGGDPSRALDIRECSTRPGRAHVMLCRRGMLIEGEGRFRPVAGERRPFRELPPRRADAPMTLPAA
jgi:hypothetical protein